MQASSPLHLELPGSAAGRTALTKRARATRAVRARGAVLVEHALLLTFVAIPTMMGITAGGVKMLADYRSSRTTLMAPIP